MRVELHCSTKGTVIRATTHAMYLIRPRLIRLQIDGSRYS